MTLPRRIVPVALVSAGSVSVLVGLWLVAGLPIVLVAAGLAAVTLGLLMEV